MQNSFSNKRFCTWTRFETEAHKNSEIAYWFNCKQNCDDRISISKVKMLLSIYEEDLTMDITSVINFVRLAALVAAICGRHALYFKQNSVIR